MGGYGGSTQALRGQVLKARPSRVKLRLLGYWRPYHDAAKGRQRVLEPASSPMVADDPRHDRRPSTAVELVAIASAHCCFRCSYVKKLVGVGVLDGAGRRRGGGARCGG